MQRRKIGSPGRKWIFSLLFVVLCGQCLSEVHEFTKENFSTQELSKGSWLVFFGSPTCPYCLQLLPTWKALASRSIEKGVTTAAVNCLTDRKICDAFGIARYPTIFFFKDGDLFEFKGQRNLESIELFYSNSYQQQIPLKLTDLSHRQTNQVGPQLLDIILTFDKKGLAWASAPFAAIALSFCMMRVRLTPVAKSKAKPS